MFGMDLFTQNYPEEGNFEKSAYYYWYLFMQLIEDYRRGHPLWKDFGDVRMPFWEWWVAHGEDLFATGQKYGVLELVTNGDIQQARSEGAYLLRIDPDCTRDYINLMFRDFLDEKGISKGAGRKQHKDEVKLARYPFYQRPDIDSLKKSLDAWKLRHQHPRPTLYNIGLQLGLCPDHIIEGKDDLNKASKLNVMNATVSRYLRWAENIKQNVAKGIFPKND